MKYFLLLFAIGMLSTAQTTVSKQTSVYFKINQSTLSTAAKKAIVTTFLSEPNLTIEKISLIGFCDVSGSAEFNKKLAAQRVQVVQDFISTTANINDRVFTTFAYGAIGNQDVHTVGDEPRFNRHVNIQVDYITVIPD